MNPLVSVVMITYGHEKFIRQAIEGVLMQKYNGQIELIIANDHSPDATDEVVKQFLESVQLPENIQVLYTKHDTNLGMMPNFIWALKSAKGKYIALCEGDDYWTDPFKLQKQIDFLGSHPDYIMCCHDRDVVDDENKVLIHNQQTTKTDKDTFVQTLVYRNVPFDDTFYKYFVKAKNGDTFLIYRLHQLGKTEYFDFNGACYRVSDAGVWSKTGADKRLSMAVDSLDNMIEYYTDRNDKNAVKEIRKWKAEQHFIYSNTLLDENRRSEALKHFSKYNTLSFENNSSHYFSVHNIKSNLAWLLRYFSVKSNPIKK